MVKFCVWRCMQPTDGESIRPGCRQVRMRSGQRIQRSDKRLGPRPRHCVGNGL